MSPAYATPEQYERWHKRTCARCGRHGCFASRWPDGHVCRTCHDRALRVRGRCPDCGTDRVLPGRRPGDGTPICPSCAGFSMSYACARCGDEGKLHARHRCTRCAFADRLGELLDDGTGRIRPQLAPLAEALLAMDNPLTGLTWLYRRGGRDGSPADLLRRLGRGQVELTHEAFHTLRPWRAAAHLRELLMACGLLPVVDKQVLLFERWLGEHLATIADPGHTQILRRFATWDVLPRLRARADRRTVTPAGRRYVGEQVIDATAFLRWLTDRDRDLADCAQADIDAWQVHHARANIRPFLLWCAKNRLTRRFDLPTNQPRRAAPLTPARRTALLGQILTDQQAPLRSRVAAAILLLYAQPVSRIARLTIDDVIADRDQVLLQLGKPPSPVPQPLAILLLDYVGRRTNMRTATNRDARWLFPGRRAGQPLHPATLSALIHDLGVPAAAGRAAAIRQHVLDMPAPVVATAFGYHHVTTTRLAADAGTTWARYAPGSHER